MTFSVCDRDGDTDGLFDVLKLSDRLGKSVNDGDHVFLECVGVRAASTPTGARRMARTTNANVTATTESGGRRAVDGSLRIFRYE